MKNRLIFLAIIPMLLCGACTNGTNPGGGGEETLKVFSDAKLHSKTFYYDGLSHSLQVTGVPEGTKIEYTNNNQTEIGNYTVTAALSKEGYNSKTLSAILIIKERLKDFEGLTFSSESVDYDGEMHSLVLAGAPDGATISYSNNDHISVGTYNVSATVSMEGYNTKTLYAELKIKGKTFTGITFNSKTFRYDGYSHSIFVENQPFAANVEYTGNNKSQVGTYTVTAKISMSGYEDLVLTASLIISDLSSFPDYEFNDYHYIYDGKEMNLKLYFESYEDNLNGIRGLDYSVVYKVNGVSMSKPVIKDVGVYTISATYSAPKYQTRTFSFKITLDDTIGGVDSSKTPFIFTKDTKYKDLYNEIMKGNYSVKFECRDEYDRDCDGIYEEVVIANNISNYFVTTEAFAARINEDASAFLSTDYYISKGSKYAFNFNSYLSSNKLVKNKFPVEDYLENVISISSGMEPFAILKESEDGGFESSKVGGYVDSIGYFEIDTVNNCLIITDRSPYYHSDRETKYWHDEVGIFTFYNIGNTKVELPESLKGNDADADSYELYGFRRNGISYSMTGSEFIANVSLNEYDNAFLGGGGTFFLEPEFDGIPIKKIDTDVYHTSYYIDRSNYDLNVYYNDDGYYEGEYSDAGFVKYYLDARKFGHIHYYGEWIE